MTKKNKPNDDYERCVAKAKIIGGACAILDAARLALGGTPNETVVFENGDTETKLVPHDSAIEAAVFSNLVRALAIQSIRLGLSDRVVNTALAQDVAACRAMCVLAGL